VQKYLRKWWRATIRTPAFNRWSRMYYARTNVYLCPECGIKAEQSGNYWKLLKRKQDVFSPARCYECKLQAPEGPPKPMKQRAIWKEP